MQQQRRRNRFILGVLALGLLAGAALTAGPAQAVDAVGPYYALPSWDRKMAAVNRFVVLTDWGSAAVLDKETGLVWEKTPSGPTVTWFAAGFDCLNRFTGGRTGWRLPSMPELASLLQPSGFIAGGPALPPGHPFVGVIHGTGSHDYYWSTTTNIHSPVAAWAVNFSGIGGSSDVTDGPKDDPTGFLVWCVRGGGYANVY